MRRLKLIVALTLSSIVLTGCSATIYKNKINDTSVKSEVSDIFQGAYEAHNMSLNMTPEKGNILEMEMPEKLKNVRIGYDKEGDFQNVEFGRVNVFTYTAGDSLCDATMVFNSKLNASELTKDFTFIDYLVIPSNYEKPATKMPQSDFQGVEVRLTEVNNPENYVSFQTVVRPDMNNVISGRAGANNQAIEGLIYPDYRYVKDYGLQVTGSFVGAFNNIIWSSGFAFDNENNSTYAFPQSSTNVKTLIRDLDDSAYMIPEKNEDIWGGFKSNELEVSLTLKGINPGATASVAILSYNGIVINNDIIDKDAPKIKIENYPEDIVGEVNTPFEIFKHTSTDNIDGYEIVNDFSVFYNYKEINEKELTILDNKFTPKIPGEYTIVARKKDSSGNQSQLETVVKIVERNEPLRMTLDSKIPENVYVGNIVKCPKAFIVGGTSNKEYGVKVLNNGKDVPLKNGEFKVDNQGVYIVRYILWDYLKNPVHFDYCINAQISDVPIVMFPQLPNIFIKNHTFEIPKFSAIDYKSLEGNPVDAEIIYTIKTPDGNVFSSNKNIFKPNSVGEYNISIKAINKLDKSKFVEKNYKINVREGNKVVDFLEFNGVETVELPSYDVAYRCKNEISDIKFIKPLPIEKFNFNFKIASGIKNFKSMDIILTDSINPFEQVTLNIYTDEYTTAGKTELCGKKSVLNTIFNQNRPYSLFYNNESLISTDGVIGKITHFDNGLKYNGFSSNLVYFTCRLTGVEGDVDIVYNEICNHTNFMKDAKDNSAPILMLKNGINADVGIGDTLIIPKAIGYDIFSGECEVTYELKKGDEVILSSSDNISEFVIYDYGKYELIYYVQDSNENMLEMSKNILVSSTIKPVITITEYFKNVHTIGKKIKLPNAVAKDYNGKELKIYAYIETPNMAVIDINDFDVSRECTISEKGIYNVKYVTYDENFVYTIVEFEFEVR